MMLDDELGLHLPKLIGEMSSPVPLPPFPPGMQPHKSNPANATGERGMETETLRIENPTLRLCVTTVFASCNKQSVPNYFSTFRSKRALLHLDR